MIKSHVKKGDVVKYVGTPPSSNWSFSKDEHHLRKFKTRKINGLVVGEPFTRKGKMWTNKGTYKLEDTTYVKVLLEDKVYVLPISWLMTIPEKK